jgi:hypothetical protein
MQKVEKRKEDPVGMCDTCQFYYYTPSRYRGEVPEDAGCSWMDFPKPEKMKDEEYRKQKMKFHEIWERMEIEAGDKGQDIGLRYPCLFWKEMEKCPVHHCYKYDGVCDICLGDELARIHEEGNDYKWEG